MRIHHTCVYNIHAYTPYTLNHALTPHLTLYAIHHTPYTPYTIHTIHRTPYTVQLSASRPAVVQSMIAALGAYTAQHISQDVMKDR
jgi:hypothetical protein